MAKHNSTFPIAQSQPKFPLTLRPDGRWCKKILGKMHYFGRDKDDALAAYLEQADALHKGLTTADKHDALTVYLLCAKFLTAKKRSVESGELSPHTLKAYTALSKRLIKVFGKRRIVADLRPEDFARLRQNMQKTWGPVRMLAETVRTRVPFNWAYKNGLLDKPMVFGEEFKPPSRKTLRKHRAAQGPKMFTADEIRAMLDKAGLPMKAMILLGINGALGNSDIGALPLSAVDLDSSWLNFARQKTAVSRRVPLWPETVAALREWLKVRPEPKDEQHAGLMFTTRWGSDWATDPAAITKEFRKLLDKLKINGHRNYYCLRHTLQTIGDGCRDFIAVRAIMGHTMGEDIATAYREIISDDRLHAVAEHVRGWLFSKPQTTRQSKRQSKAQATQQSPNQRLFTA